MTTIHETYVEATPALVPFEGTRSELRGGEYLGHGTQYEKMKPGDIVTRGADGYFFDPYLRVVGSSLIRAAADNLCGSTWREIGEAI